VSSQVRSSALSDYSELVLEGIRANIHTWGPNYIMEVSFMKILSTYLSNMLWASATSGLGYQHISKNASLCSCRADLRSTSPDRAITVINEAKYFVLDWPTRLSEGKQWDGSLARQHIGTKPGKDNNGVHDVTVKLPSICTGSHVSFLLVKFASIANLGKADVIDFIAKAGLGSNGWQFSEKQWIHPTDSNHHVHAYLWCRELF